MKRHTEFHSHTQRRANADKTDLPGIDTSLKQGAGTPTAGASPDTGGSFAETFGNKALVDEVRHSKLRTYTQKQLEGRLADYTRRYDRELDSQHRTAFKREITRTRFELNWRRMNPTKVCGPISPPAKSGPAEGESPPLELNWRKMKEEQGRATVQSGLIVLPSPPPSMYKIQPRPEPRNLELDVSVVVPRCPIVRDTTEGKEFNIDREK